MVTHSGGRRRVGAAGVGSSGGAHVGTAITSAQAGDWQNTATWVGGVVPRAGNSSTGDTVTILHAVTVNSLGGCGNSPASAGATALTITSGSLTVSGVLLINGPVSQGNVPVTFNAGSTLEISAAAATTPLSQHYAWTISSTHNQLSARINFSGSSGSHVTVRSNSGGGAGYFTDGAFLQGGLMTATFADFTKIGLAGTPASACGVTSTATYSVSNCTMANCGHFPDTTFNLGADCTFLLSNNTYTSSAAPESMQITSATPLTSGSRSITGCNFDALVNFFPPQDLSVTGNIFYGGYTATNGTPVAWSGNLVRITSATENLPAAGNITNDYIAYDQPAATNPHGIQAGLFGGRTYNLSGIIFDFNGTDDTGDCIVFGTPASAAVVNISTCLVLPNPNGTSRFGTLLSALGNANITFTIDHCTAMIGVEPAVSIGETFIGFAGMCTKLKNNNFYGVVASPVSFKVADSGTDDNVPDYVTAANCDFNNGFQFAAGSNLKGYQHLEFSAGSPGASDLNVNPNFHDATRRISTWDASLGGPGTYANAFTQMMARNPSYTITALRTYVLAGFSPSNIALHNSASDGTDIGAVAYSP